VLDLYLNYIKNILYFSQEVDFALGPFEIIDRRYLVADVSTIVINKKYNILSSGIMLPNNDQYGLLSLFKSFSTQVWIMISFSFLYVLLSFSLIELRNKRSSLNSIKIEALHLYEIVSKNSWNYFGHLFKQSNYKIWKNNN
jgi:hypothetical protein